MSWNQQFLTVTAILHVTLFACLAAFGEMGVGVGLLIGRAGRALGIDALITKRSNKRGCSGCCRQGPSPSIDQEGSWWPLLMV